MKIQSYLSLLFAILTISIHAQDLKNLVLRNDNDIATFRDSVSLKEVMPTDLKVHVSDLMTLRCKELREDCDLKNIYIQTFKINSNDGRSFQKYFSFYSKELKDAGTETMILRRIKSVKDRVVTIGVTSRDMTFQINSELPDETITIEK